MRERVVCDVFVLVCPVGVRWYCKSGNRAPRRVLLFCPARCTSTPFIYYPSATSEKVTLSALLIDDINASTLPLWHQPWPAASTALMFR